jgi:FkbM family methyltransferase
LVTPASPISPARRQVGHIHTLAGKGPAAACLEVDLGPADTPRLFAFEPDATNYAMLRDAFAVVLNHTTAGKHAIPPSHAELRNAAVSDKRGRMPFGFGGGEISSFKFRWGGAAPTMVDTVALDDELLGRADPVDRVDFVKSDTEGHDWWAMQGARRLLEERRVGMWFFEYHGVGLWDPAFGDGHVTLQHVVAYLAGIGYSSYYVGKEHLLRIDGAHWRGPYESRVRAPRPPPRGRSRSRCGPPAARRSGMRCGRFSASLPRLPACCSELRLDRRAAAGHASAPSASRCLARVVPAGIW